MTREEFSVRIVDMQDALYRVAFGMLLSMQDCEDVVQECILKAWRSLDRLRDDKYLKTWVIRILINECYALMRSRKRIVPLNAEPEAGAPPDSRNEALYEAVAALDDKLRLPLILHYIEGYKEAEIAAMLRCPQGTVKSRLRKARSLMRDALQSEGRLSHARG